VPRVFHRQGNCSQEYSEPALMVLPEPPSLSEFIYLTDAEATRNVFFIFPFLFSFSESRTVGTFSNFDHTIFEKFQTVS
jgi:hypothetical protein